MAIRPYFHNLVVKKFFHSDYLEKHNLKLIRRNAIRGMQASYSYLI